MRQTRLVEGMQSTASLDRRKVILESILEYYIQWLLLAAVIIMAALNADFRRPGNLVNILLQSSFVGIGAAGMTLLIISGAFDISVASIIGLCAVAMAKLIPIIGLPAAILSALVLGTLLGLINGFVVAILRIPAFIATLGTMYAYLGIGFILGQGGHWVIVVSSPLLFTLGSETILGILPIPFLVMTVTYGVCYVLLRKTYFGRFLRAVGSNRLAANAAGIRVIRVQITAFVAVALCATIAAVLLAGEMSSATPIMATGYELNAIASVVIGGTSLQGGKGTLLGSFTGALFFAVINNALNILGVEAYWQYVVSGGLLISAIAIQSMRTYVTSAD